MRQDIVEAGTASRHTWRDVRCLLASACAVAITATGGGRPDVLAAKPPRYFPVTVTFRCAHTMDCASGDRVQGDPTGAYVGSNATLVGAFLNPGHDLALRLEPQGGQYLFLGFSQPTGTAPCVSTGTCQRVGSYAFTSVQTFDTMPDSLLNPVDAADKELPQGLLSIPVNVSMNARFKINFADPYGRAIPWTVRFNPTAYPGSDYVTVLRTGPGAWTVTTTARAIGKLVSTGSKGNQATVDEGTFALPFQFTITQP
jgi:hypothetical protein